MIDCFSIVSASIGIADKKFGKAWKINEKDYKSVETVCGLMDNVMREFNATSFTVDVDEKRTDIIMSFECEDFEVESKKHDLYTLFHCAYDVQIKNGNKEEMLMMRFRFPGVWDLV